MVAASFVFFFPHSSLNKTDDSVYPQTSEVVELDITVELPENKLPRKMTKNSNSCQQCAARMNRRKRERQPWGISVENTTQVWILHHFVALNEIKLVTEMFLYRPEDTRLTDIRRFQLKVK